MRSQTFTDNNFLTIDAICSNINDILHRASVYRKFYYKSYIYNTATENKGLTVLIEPRCVDPCLLESLSK